MKPLVLQKGGDERVPVPGSMNVALLLLCGCVTVELTRLLNQRSECCWSCDGWMDGH